LLELKGWGGGARLRKEGAEELKGRGEVRAEGSRGLALIFRGAQSIGFVLEHRRGAKELPGQLALLSRSD